MCDGESLLDWPEADLCDGSGRNEAIFFSDAWRCAKDDDRAKLLEVAELAAAFRWTSTDVNPPATLTVSGVYAFCRKIVDNTYLA